MQFNKIKDLVHKEYVKNGYQERWTVAYLIEHPEELELIIHLAEVGLFVTEVTEIMEDVRKGDLIHSGEEAADTVIRVMNWCTRAGIDLETEILNKHVKNMKREKLHGKKI